MKRSATSVWQGSGKEGNGKLSLQSGAMEDHPYSFSARFEENGKKGTNPEELIAAAHAGCFNMALAVELGKNNYEPTELKTVANVELNKGDSGFSIDKIHLTLTAQIAHIDEQEFQRIAEGAKKNCPVSKVLSGAEISLEAKLR